MSDCRVVDALFNAMEELEPDDWSFPHLSLHNLSKFIDGIYGENLFLALTDLIMMTIAP